MRVRRLKWAKEFLENANVVVQQPEEYKGKWNELFQCECIHLEIGSGKGDYWIKMSEMYPDIAWIGMEKNESVAAFAVKKAEIDCENRKFIQHDAMHLLSYFDKEIDVIHLNFSDPWPKKRTTKRRLSHENFTSIYKQILKDDGEIQMKTDNADLFEYSLVNILKEGFTLQEMSVDFRRETHDEDAISEYEQKFMNKGNPIYRAVFKKVVEVQ